jgi:coproporphyrinogen III oxidase-like Fe-S oxidoreductase
MLDRITEMTGQAGLARYEISAYARPGHRAFTTPTTGSLATTWGMGAGAHSKLSFAHRVVRQTRFRDPRLYMDNALAGRPGAGRRRAPRRPAV